MTCLSFSPVDYASAGAANLFNFSLTLKIIHIANDCPVGKSQAFPNVGIREINAAFKKSDDFLLILAFTHSSVQCIIANSDSCLTPPAPQQYNHDSENDYD